MEAEHPTVPVERADTRIVVYVTASERDRLSAAARATDRTVSAAMRLAARRYADETLGAVS